jgi:adenylate cyclase
MSERCILFADVVGSTALYEKLGDAEAKYAVERCLKRAQMSIAHFGGRTVKNVGDGLLADFPEAGAAVAAACQMQQRIADLPPVAGQKLTLRIGFHSGEVIDEAGDIFGDSVNLAARLADVARAGQIIASAATLRRLPALTLQSVRALPAVMVKGKTEPVPVCEVIWHEEGGLTLVAGDTQPRQVTGARLTLHYESTVRELDAYAPSLTIGRDKGCGLVVHDPRASRVHAAIERRGDKFMLIDQSTNGTWLSREGEVEVKLSREEAPLLGRGRISLGHPAAATHACITFISE